MTTPPKNNRWLAPLAVAVGVAAFGFWCNTRVRQTLEAQIRADLSTIIDANVTALRIWTTNQINLATALASDSSVHRPALALLGAADSANGAQSNRPDGVDATSEPRADLDRHLRPRLEQVGYRLAHLVTTNLTLVSGTSRGRFRGRPAVLEEHVARYSELFETGQPVLITPFRPRRPPGSAPGQGQERFSRGITNFGSRPWNSAPFDRTNPASGTPGARRPPDRPEPRDRPPTLRRDFTLMQVAVPLRDELGRVVGAFALMIDPEREFTRILSVARSGASGETYALDQQGLLVSRSRFDEQLRRLGLLDGHPESTSALTLRLADPGSDLPNSIAPDDPANPTRSLARLAAGALSGIDGSDVTPSRDYRGVPVVGAWRWLPDLGFGVVTQLDATEAFRSLRVLNFLFLILLLLLLLCSTGMLLVSRASLVWRRRLDEAELRLRTLGQYTLEERIGEGAMGVVYRARHGLLRRDTAVKLLVPERADPDAVARFEREVCLSCQLAHPNTIQVFDYGRTPDGIFYYAMEFLRGLNLHDLVDRYGPQPEARVIHVLAQVCDSLGEAHALGLVHRDIKPANVFLCHRAGIPDCVKVLDFGLVRDYRRSESIPAESGSAVEGTPSYIPPEAIHQRLPIGPRSDLYSVGALGYFLVSGQPLFDAANAAELLEKHVHERPAPPSRRTPNAISQAFESLLLECLAKNPDERPASASTLRERLAALPAATGWDSSRAEAWWNDHPEARENSTSLRKPSSPAAEPTLRVDLRGRHQA